MENPLVSIIIPVYKVERYIERCLLSVMRQDCQGISMECILVDDCTPDDSMSIAEKLLEGYSGDVEFRIVHHEKNLGLSAARNTGMRKATGKYLFFLDSDDYITDDCMRKQTDVVRACPEVQVVKGNHKGRGEVLTERIPKGVLDKDTLLVLLYRGFMPIMAWNTLIKKSLVEQWNLSFREGLVFEDNLWTIQLFRYTECMLLVPEITYYYEENPDSILGNHDVVLCPAKFLPHKIIIIEELLNIFDTRHFVSYTCYVVSQLMQMFDSIAKNRSVDDKIRMRILQLRNRLMKYTLRNGRLVLAVYELLLFMPFLKLLQYRWFRHNYDRIKLVTYKIAKCFDRLHFSNS